jgi:hypothetical protein
MNIASCLKMLALGMSCSLLFVASVSHAAQYIYAATDVNATIHTHTGQHDEVEIQQGSKQELSGNNINDFLGNAASADIFNIPGGAYAKTSEALVVSNTTGTTLEQINASADQYQLMSLVSITSYGEAQDFGTSSAYKTPFVLSVFAVGTITINGVAIPAGSLNFGEKFDVTGPVPVTLPSGTETDTFNGKLVMGEVHALRDRWGNIEGTRFAVIHIYGKLTDSAGNTYDVDQNIGQNDIKGVRPDQISVAYTYVEN